MSLPQFSEATEEVVRHWFSIDLVIGHSGPTVTDVDCEITYDA